LGGLGVCLWFLGTISRGYKYGYIWRYLAAVFFAIFFDTIFPEPHAHEKSSFFPEPHAHEY